MLKHKALQYYIHNIITFLIKHKYILGLAMLIVVVGIVNVDPNKYLIGWDSLLIELDPWLNFKRNLFSVWEEYQGLGLTAGNAHAVEALRSILILVFDLFLPLRLIRYFYTFVCIAGGVFSIFYLLKKHAFYNKEYFAFIGALYYLFNLGTIQNFYAPFEPFSAFYAVLPLTVLLFLNYLQGGKKSYFYMVGGFILATFAFQVPTIFIVNSILFLALFIVYFIQKFSHSNCKKVFGSGFTYLAINLFWLLPFFYFLVSNISIRFSSISSRLSSDVAFYQNVRYANIYDLALLRGFWFSNTDYIEGATGYMMLPWVEWIGKTPILYLGYAFFFVILIGLLPFKRDRLYYFMFFVFFISWFFLFNINGLTGILYKSLVGLIPIIGEIFRFPFTKWIVPISFAYAYFFSRGIFLSSLIFSSRKKYIKYLKFSFASVPVLAVLIFIWPIFKSELFYFNLKQEVPKEYFELVEYFRSEPKEKRIALFPMTSFWGWQFNDWGYRGSGFLWFGIEQPILSRTFDVWHQNNEQFYHEFQYAIYSQDQELFSYLVKKYQVDYILDDTSVISPNADRAIFREGLQKVLKNSEFELAKTFGKIKVYKIYDSEALSFIETPSTISLVGDSYFFSNIDPNSVFKNPYYFEIEGGYKKFFSDDNSIGEFYKKDLVLENILNSSAEDMFVKMGSFDNNESIPALVEFDGENAKINYIYPAIYSANGRSIFTKDYAYDLSLPASEEVSNLKFLFNNTLLESAGFGQKLLVNKENSLVSFSDQSNYQVDFSKYLYSAEVDDCNGSIGDFSKNFGLLPGTVDLSIEKGQMCLNLEEEIQNIEPSIYEISFDHRETTGAKLFYCLYDTKANACLNNKYNNAPDKSQLYSFYRDYTEVSSPTNLKLKIVVEADISNSIKLASLKNIRLIRYPIGSAVTYYPPPEVYNTNAIVSVSKNDFPLRVDLSMYDDFGEVYYPGDNAFNFTKQNCNSFNEKSFDRVLVKINDNKSYYAYKALDAISCDRVDIKKSAKASYLMTFDVENIEGKSFDLCITGNELDKCVIQDRLVNEERDTFVVPSYPAAETFSVNINNQSIGSLPTENHLYMLDVKYIPYNWLKGLSLLDRQNLVDSNLLKIKDVKKTSPYYYFMHVETNPVVKSGSDKGYIVLNQNYSEGWHLYSSQECFFGIKSAFTCKTIGTHVLAKNWANGWVLDSDQIEAENAYFIVFLPQYLQFGGYIGLLFVAIYLAFIIYKKKKGLVICKK